MLDFIETWIRSLIINSDIKYSVLLFLAYEETDFALLTFICEPIKRDIFFTSFTADVVRGQLCTARIRQDRHVYVDVHRGSVSA